MRGITAGLFVWLVACGGAPSTENVVKAYCARQFRCCLEDARQYKTIAECEEETAKKFPHGIHMDRALEYLELSKEECGQQDRHGWDRARIWQALPKPRAEVLQVGYACERNDQCPTLYDANWRVTGQSTCSCPVQGRENGKCVVQKTCQPPAKFLEKCAPFPDRIACDSGTFCSIGDGDKSGVCVRRRHEGQSCKGSRECLQYDPMQCIKGKCELIQPSCGI